LSLPAWPGTTSTGHRCYRSARRFIFGELACYRLSAAKVTGYSACLFSAPSRAGVPDGMTAWLMTPSNIGGRGQDVSDDPADLCLAPPPGWGSARRSGLTRVLPRQAGRWSPPDHRPCHRSRCGCAATRCRTQAGQAGDQTMRTCCLPVPVAGRPRQSGFDIAPPRSRALLHVTKVSIGSILHYLADNRTWRYWSRSLARPADGVTRSQAPLPSQWQNCLSILPRQGTDRLSGRRNSWEPRLGISRRSGQDGEG
jgi:hypothetical protein